MLMMALHAVFYGLCLSLGAVLKLEIKAFDERNVSTHYLFLSS